MKLEEQIGETIESEACRKIQRDTEMHHNRFRDAIGIEPDFVSVGEFGVIIVVDGYIFRPWPVIFGKRLYQLVVYCQNCGRIVHRWPLFSNLKGMKKALKALVQGEPAPEEEPEYRFLCLFCSSPLRGLYERMQRRETYGFLGLVTFGGKYWPPFGIIKAGDVRIQQRDRFREALCDRQVEDVSYDGENRFSITFDNGLRLECSITTLLRMGTGQE